MTDREAFANRIQAQIKDEAEAARYYRALADIAKSPGIGGIVAYDVLRTISRQEEGHKKKLEQILSDIEKEGERAPVKVKVEKNHHRPEMTRGRR